MTKSDELHKNDYSENAVEIHQLQAPNRTSRKDEVSNIKHDLIHIYNNTQNHTKQGPTIYVISYVCTNCLWTQSDILRMSWYLEE